MKGSISKTGYKANSKDKDNDYNIIPSGNITMKNVPHNVLGIDDLGNVMLMTPGNDYKFKGDNVFEIPMKEKGGTMKNKPMTYPAFLAMGGSPFFYAQTGGYVPPSDAQKVTQVPSNFQFSGTADNKKYFVQNMQAPGAITGTTSASSDAHRQFLIKQLQSGVKAEDLVTAGHATTAGIQPLLGYYKPSVVYIEPQNTTQPVPQKQPIPLNESDRVEMKQIFPPSGNKYLTFQVPDANAGYNNATEQYYDPKTFRQIDPLKSFDNTGNYSPSFLYSDPTQGTLSEKYRGTKIATRYDTTKIGKTDSLNVNPDIMNGSKVGYQSGGPVFDKKMMGNFLDAYFKKDKNVAPQGQDTNTFVENKVNDFTNHLRSNVMKHLITEETDAIDHFLKCGGTIKAQEGAQVDWYDPNNPLTPRPTNNMMDFYNGPFGGADMNSIPPYVQSMQGAYPGMVVDNNSSSLSGLNLQPGADANAIAYQQYLKQWEDKNKSVKRNDNIATGLMAGMSIFNNVSESARSREYQKKLRDQNSAENLFPTQKGSRGDYDINSGMFKPNQMTPVSYKRGGTYYMDEKELKQFLAAGGQIEIID